MLHLGPNRRWDRTRERRARQTPLLSWMTPVGKSLLVACSCILDAAAAARFNTKGPVGKRPGTGHRIRLISAIRQDPSGEIGARQEAIEIVEKEGHEPLSIGGSASR